MASKLSLILSSFGLKRKLTSLLQVAAALSAQIPGLQQYASVIENIAAYLGVGAVAHAGVSKTLNKVPLSTIASFFSALHILAESVPALQPYTSLIRMLATISAFLATGSIVGGGKG